MDLAIFTASLTSLASLQIASAPKDAGVCSSRCTTTKFQLNSGCNVPSSKPDGGVGKDEIFLVFA